MIHNKLTVASRHRPIQIRSNLIYCEGKSLTSPLPKLVVVLLVCFIRYSANDPEAMKERREGNKTLVSRS